MVEVYSGGALLPSCQVLNACKVWLWDALSDSTSGRAMLVLSIDGKSSFPALGREAFGFAVL